MSATRVSVGWRRAGGGDVVDPWREAAPAWRPRWCLLWRSCDADDQDESKGPFSIVSGSSRMPTAPHPRGRPRPDHKLHRHRLRAAWAKRGRARGRAGGRILVTVVSTSRLPVVAKMSRTRWPSSPTARSCGCLHRGSNVQAVSKAGEAAARLPVPIASARGIAPRRARSLRSRAGTGADIAPARPLAACAPASRAQRQGRPKLRRMRGGRPGWGHTCGW